MKNLKKELKEELKLKKEKEESVLSISHESHCLNGLLDGRSSREPSRSRICEHSIASSANESLGAQTL